MERPKTQAQQRHEKFQEQAEKAYRLADEALAEIDECLAAPYRKVGKPLIHYMCEPITEIREVENIETDLL